MEKLVLVRRERKPTPKKTRHRKPYHLSFAAKKEQATAAYAEAAVVVRTTFRHDCEAIIVALQLALVMRQRRAAFEASSRDRQAKYVADALNLVMDQHGFVPDRRAELLCYRPITDEGLEIARVYRSEQRRGARKRVHGHERVSV